MYVGGSRPEHDKRARTVRPGPHTRMDGRARVVPAGRFEPFHERFSATVLFDRRLRIINVRTGNVHRAAAQFGTLFEKRFSPARGSFLFKRITFIRRVREPTIITHRPCRALKLILPFSVAIISGKVLHTHTPGGVLYSYLYRLPYTPTIIPLVFVLNVRQLKFAHRISCLGTVTTTNRAVRFSFVRRLVLFSIYTLLE